MDSVGQISPADPHGGSPGKDQQAAGVGILLQIMMLVLSFILGHVLRRHRFYYLPEASASLLIGLIVGGLANISNTETSIRAWFNFHEEFFFLFLLPPIIFQSGFSLAPKPFFSNFGAIVTFAILGTFIAAIVTGLLVYLGGVMYLMYRLPLVECLMFGALISATDPVTVLSIFQELGTDMNLYALVFGESVLNDAMAISLYRTMSLVKSNSSGQNFFLIIVRFLETFVGSMSAGVGVGFTSALLFKYAGLDIDNLQNLECCLFVLFPYFSYMLAEGLGLSGIVSILFTGMVMKHYSFSNLSENSQKFVAAFFHLISSLAETFVFIYMGFDIAMEQHSWSHIGFIFFSIIFIGLARAANVFTCGYLLNLVRPAQRQIPVTHQKALWYSGLRGAMAFALALQSAHDLPEGHGQTIFTATTAIVVLTEELTKAMKAKEAREKKKAKLVEDIHSHMTELQSLLKQENTLVERKQSMENKKKIVENLMAGLQHVLTTNKLTLLIFFTAALTLLTTMVNPQATPTCKPTDHGPVVPTTPLVIFLETIQQTALKTFGPKHFDPKVYVDLSLKFDLPKVRQGFTDLPRAANGSVSVSDFNGFLEKFMNGVHEDLVYIEPVDFVVEPEGFLKKVVNENVREWGLEVHSLWKSLSRKVSNRVLENPELFTLLPLKYPVIIPGSRFQEVYYWDSYWVIRGLLVSKMYETAKGIVFNLIDLIDTYGYVLNGARAYYTNRSQPPLLSSMVIEVYKRTKDIELVKKALPALIKEHKFWNLGIHNVIIEDAQGARHNLSRYYAMWNQPRPESFTIDTETADKLTNDCEKEQLYRELATTAETGWDFSTRWMRDTFDLTTLSTTMIVPVDLNAFVLKMELDIAFLANVVAESHHVTHFHRASKARKKAMDTVFWNEEKGQWFDYWLNDSSKSMDVYKFDASYQNQDIFASNFIPLWVESFNSDETVVKKVTQSLQSSGLVRAAGIATSLTNSSQQWDFPNGWAPVQHMIVEGLVRSGSKEARSLAKDIAIRWIRTNYVTYKTSKAMHEKYDVSKCGEFGGGGEYVPQTGFGWSNGVALAFLEEFGWAEDLSPYCQ